MDHHADRDPGAFLEFVSADAIFHGSTEVLRGREEVARGWSPYFEGPEAPFSWEPDTTEELSAIVTDA